MIKIITIHSIHNFGSVFQAFALQKYLIGLGYDVEIIDYRPKYFYTGRNRIKTIIGKIVNIKAYQTRKSKFENFITNYMILSDRNYSCIDQLYMLDNGSDIFIAGGDQLWNDYHFSGTDEAFKLSFVKNSTKFAFGTSMGRDDFTENEINKLMSSIHDFVFIGLREKSSVNFIAKAGSNVVSHVVDPVLLLERKYFENMAVKPVINNYVFIYLVDKSELLDSIVDYVRDKYGYNVVLVSGFRKKSSCDYFIKDAGPEEILGLLLNAEIVISASFHATLFSILFNKKFISLLPNLKTNARITELLDFVGLSSRIVSNKNEIMILSESIDYINANSIMNKFIDTSKIALNNVLINIT